MPAFEDDYLDVLQNLEVSIVGVYRAHPALLDSQVEKALNAALLEYQAERKQRALREPALIGLPAQVYAALKLTCDWRLGRATLESLEDDLAGTPVTPLTVDEIIACLKRIRKSVQMWNRDGGQRGYLTFIDPFLP